MLKVSFRLRSASPAYLDARRSAVTDCASAVPVRTHFRIALPSTAPSIGMRITINERKHAALSRQTVKLNALTSSPHAPQPCHHGYAPLPNWRPTHTTNTHFSGYQFTHSNPPLRATADLIPQPTGTTTPHTPTHTS